MVGDSASYFARLTGQNRLNAKEIKARVETTLVFVEQYFCNKYYGPMEFKSLKTILEKHQLLANKSLGQHFLHDESICKRMVRHLDLKVGTVVEIGPGPGSLTDILLKENPRFLLAIEKDQRFINILKEFEAKQILVHSEKDLYKEVENCFLSLTENENYANSLISNIPLQLQQIVLKNGESI